MIKTINLKNNPMKKLVNVLKYTLLFAVVASVFSCGKDDDMGGEASKVCTIQAVYKDDVLLQRYEKISPNAHRRTNYFEQSGAVLNYQLTEKDTDGRIVNESTFSEDDIMLSNLDFTYNQGGIFPDLITFQYYSNGAEVANGYQVNYYNEGDCKLDRIELYDENQTMTARTYYTYLDDNCSYNIKRYWVDASENDESLSFEWEYTLDSFKSRLGEFRRPYWANHNSTDCFDVMNNVDFRKSIFEYNEYGYPISRESTYTYLDGTSEVENLRYEYECE